jgi:hypothetical protein
MTFSIEVDGAAPQVEMPVGEGFPKTGFIAPWTAKVMYRVGWFERDLDTEVKDFHAELPSVFGEEGEPRSLLENPYDARDVSRSGDKFQYYYEDKERALALCEILNEHEPKEWRINPEQAWYFVTQVDDICGLDEDAKAKFGGPELAFAVKIVTLRSKKYRHAYHFLALPSFISAYAQATGLKVPGFDLSPLTAAEDEVVFNAETEMALIGDADAGYDDAHFWKERVALWAALGEDDAQKSHTKEADTRYSTGSDKLNNLLQPTVKPWLSPVYARLIPVPDPRLAAAYTRDDRKIRPSIPVIAQVFVSGEEAAQVAAAERAEMTGTKEDEGLKGDTYQLSSSSDGPAVPEVWKEAPNEWRDQVIAIKGKLKGPPPTWKGQLADVVAGLGFDVGATLDEIEAWLSEV